MFGFDRDEIWVVYRYPHRDINDSIAHDYPRMSTSFATAPIPCTPPLSSQSGPLDFFRVLYVRMTFIPLHFA